MNVKTDTKEKIYCYYAARKQFVANMSAALKDLLLPYLSKRHSAYCFQYGNVIDSDEQLLWGAGRYTAAVLRKQCILCDLQQAAKCGSQTGRKGIAGADECNTYEREAWDIVQMEEIERELLEGDDFKTPGKQLLFKTGCLVMKNELTAKQF